MLNRVVSPDAKTDAVTALRPGWAGKLGELSVSVVPHGASPTDDEGESGLVIRGTNWSASGDRFVDVRYDGPERLEVTLFSGAIEYYRNWVITPNGVKVCVLLKQRTYMSSSPQHQ